MFINYFTQCLCLGIAVKVVNTLRIRRWANLAAYSQMSDVQSPPGYLISWPRNGPPGKAPKSTRKFSLIFSPPFSVSTSIMIICVPFLEVWKKLRKKCTTSRNKPVIKKPQIRNQLKCRIGLSGSSKFKSKTPPPLFPEILFQTLGLNSVKVSLNQVLIDVRMKRWYILHIRLHLEVPRGIQRRVHV